MRMPMPLEHSSPTTWFKVHQRGNDSLVPLRLVVGHDEAALSVPRDAVSADAVFVIREGAAHRVPVTVRWTDGDRAVVTADLHAGDAVAVEIDAKLGFMLALMKPAIEASIHENLDRLFASGDKARKQAAKPAAKKK